MPIITISRQLGSLGGQVAREAAELLGYQLVWRDLINKSALLAGAPGTALAVIDDLGLLGIDLSTKEIRAYRKALKQVMLDLYTRGDVVIVGRAGQTILRKKAGVLHVRVIAPAELRAERIAAQQHISLENAIAQVEASDKNRRKFLKRFYKVDWADPLLYDLVVNTASLSPTACASLIVHAATRQPENSIAGKAKDQ